MGDVSKINILFINPSAMPAREQRFFLDKTSILRVPDFSMPIGLLDIAAYLRQRFDNVNIKILDIAKDLHKKYLNYRSFNPVTLEEFIESELDQVDFQPDLIGVSILFSTAHASSKIIIGLVKKKWEKAVVVCGGNHASNYSAGLLKNSDIDYVIRGEGELSFAELLNNIINKTERDITGVFDLKKLTVGRGSGELSLMIEDLDTLPLPAFDLLDLDYYRKTIGGSLMFSRGCPFHCTFCASHTVHGRRIRFKSFERIMAEFELLIVKNNFAKIVIEDDLFAVDKKKFLAIADKIAKDYGSIKFLLPQGLSVAVLDEEIIDAMIKMGMDEASLAIESGSEYVQKNIIKKNVSLVKARRILDYFRQKNFYIYVNFILGFPGETKEMMQETIKFIDSLDVDWVYIFRALPLPGSEIYNNLVAQGIIDPNNFDWDGLRLGIRAFDTPEISAADLERLAYDENITRNFFNHSNLRNGRYERAIEIFNRLIINPFPFHIVGIYCRALAYMKLGEKEKSTADFKECLRWINDNAESKRLYARYGDKMEYLREYIKTTS